MGESSTAGASGVLTLATGTTTNATSGTGPATGAITVATGAAATATTGTGGASGAVTVESVAGGLASGATGTGGASGALTLRSGAGGATTDTAAGVETGGASGAVAISSGTGGAIDNLSTGTAGAGGDVTITAGAGGGADAGSSTGGASGNIILTVNAGGASASGTVGEAGTIYFRTAALLPMMYTLPTPTSDSTTSTNMTEAELLGGMHVKSPTSAQNWQVPTGTEISTAIGSGLAVGDGFNFILINTGTASDIVTLVVDTGVTMRIGANVAADEPEFPFVDDHVGFVN